MKTKVMEFVFLGGGRRNEKQSYGIFFLGGGGTNKVHYGRCASGVQVTKFSYPWCYAACARQVINSVVLYDYMEMLYGRVF